MLSGSCHQTCLWLVVLASVVNSCFLFMGTIVTGVSICGGHLWWMWAPRRVVTSHGCLVILEQQREGMDSIPVRMVMLRLMVVTPARHGAAAMVVVTGQGGCSRPAAGQGRAHWWWRQQQQSQGEEVVGAAAAGPGREGGAAAHGSGTSMLLCHTPG